MSAKFTMIPMIYAQDLSFEIRDELRNCWEWDSQIYGALHSGSGIFTIHDKDTLAKLPKFIDWMIGIGVWTKSDIDLISFSEWRQNHPDGSYIEFENYLKENGRRNRITFGMLGA